MAKEIQNNVGNKLCVFINGEQHEIDLLPASEENASELVSFHNAYYGTNRKPEHWVWEYKQFEPEKSVFVCARDAGKLIATRGVMPVYMDVGGERTLSGKGENSLCLPYYRGTDIYSSLRNYSLDICKSRGMQFSWGFTAAVKAFQRLGGVYYSDVIVMMRPGNVWIDILWRLKGKGPLHRRFGGAAKAILKSFVFRQRNGIPEIEKLAGYEIDRDGTINERDLQDLYKRIGRNYRNMICISLDERYLAWRIRKHPFLTYREYQVHKDGELAAYAFITMSQGTAVIADMLSEDGHATSLLLDTIIKDYRRRAGRFRFMGNSKDYIMQDIFARLSDYGFSVDKKTSDLWYLGVNDLGIPQNDGFNDMGNWHITGLWTEGFLY